MCALSVQYRWSRALHGGDSVPRFDAIVCHFHQAERKHNKDVEEWHHRLNLTDFQFAGSNVFRELWRAVDPQKREHDELHRVCDNACCVGGGRLADGGAVRHVAERCNHEQEEDRAEPFGSPFWSRFGSDKSDANVDVTGRGNQVKVGLVRWKAALGRRR